MSVQSDDNKSGPYNCNDSVVAFAGEYKIFDKDGVLVTHTDALEVETVLTVDVDYTVSAIDDDGFTVTTVETYATGERITLSRNVEQTQENTFRSQGARLAVVNENSHDKAMMAIQDLSEQLSRCIKEKISTVDPVVDAAEYLADCQAAALTALAAAAEASAVANTFVAVGEEFTASPAQVQFTTSYEIPENLDSTVVFIDGVKQAQSTLTVVATPTNTVDVGAALLGGEKVEIMSTIVASPGLVTSVFGRTDAVLAATNDYTWAQIDKTVSDLADLATKSHTSLSDIGTKSHATLDSEVGANTAHAGSAGTDHSDVGLNNTHRGVSSGNPHSVTKTEVSLGNVPNVDSQNASNLNSGTVDGDRLPAMSTTKKGGVPATGSPTGKYLKDDGTFDTPAGTTAIAYNQQVFTAGAPQTQFTTSFTIPASNKMLHVFIDGVKQDDSTITRIDANNFTVGAALSGGQKVEATQISW